MNGTHFIIIIGLVVAVALFTGACGSSSSTPMPTSTPTPTSTLTATSTPTSTPSGGVTAGQLANSGKTVYANSCARCHGAQGQGGPSGPTIIGTGEALGRYQSAQGLLSFISLSMPRDAPDSLSPQQYLQVLSYLLVQNNFVSSSTVLDTSQLGSLQLR